MVFANTTPSPFYPDRAGGGTLTFQADPALRRERHAVGVQRDAGQRRACPRRLPGRRHGGWPTAAARLSLPWFERFATAGFHGEIKSCQLFGRVDSNRLWHLPKRLSISRGQYSADLHVAIASGTVASLSGASGRSVVRLCFAPNAQKNCRSRKAIADLAQFFRGQGISAVRGLPARRPLL